MKKVLVLGGSGFIGRNIVQELLESTNYLVTVADVKENQSLNNMKMKLNWKERLEIIIDDFTDFGAFNILNGPFDQIYMLAAIVGVNKTLMNPFEVIKVNTMLTINTIKWIEKNPTKRILFSSSSENYAGTSDLFNIDIPTSENVPLTISDITHPRWSYAISKIHGESTFLNLSKEKGPECVIVRYQNIIGPEMGFGHAIPHIVERFVKGNEDPFKIYGHDQTRAFCFIDDAVLGTIGAMENKASDGEIYHIGNVDEISMDELTKYIGELLNYQGKYENAETYPGSVSRRCPNINKAREHFSYSPNYHWKDAVKKTVEWYEEFFNSGNVPESGGFSPPGSVKRLVK